MNCRGTFATKAIITQGLHLDRACKGTLTAWRFNVYAICKEKPEVGGGGGPYPGCAWNKIDDISKFFKPVCDIPYYDLNHFYGKKMYVVIQIQIGKKSIRKIYAFNEKLKGAVITISNIINSTQTRINPIISNIRHIASKAKIMISNIKSKS